MGQLIYKLVEWFLEANMADTSKDHATAGKTHGIGSTEKETGLPWKKLHIYTIGWPQSVQSYLDFINILFDTLCP